MNYTRIYEKYVTHSPLAYKQLAFIIQLKGGML